MDNKDLMIKFINEIINRKILTEFIKEFFGYEYLEDYNYIFRMIDEDYQVIIDIYDNVSDSRFNRYIYDFVSKYYDNFSVREDGVNIRKINITNLINADDKILKLGYLFKLDKKLMLECANQFMNIKFVRVLECIIENKPIL